MLEKDKLERINELARKKKAEGLDEIELAEQKQLREEYIGAQDYDFLLRCIDVTNKIVHIPAILYHCRSYGNN